SPVATSLKPTSSTSVATAASASSAKRPTRIAMPLVVRIREREMRMRATGADSREDLPPGVREPLEAERARRFVRGAAGIDQGDGVVEEEGDALGDRVGGRLGAHPAGLAVRDEVRQIAARRHDRRDAGQLGLEHHVAERLTLLRQARTAVNA